MGLRKENVNKSFPEREVSMLKTNSLAKKRFRGFCRHLIYSKTAEELSTVSNVGAYFQTLDEKYIL